jgi:hypothetical protein
MEPHTVKEAYILCRKTQALAIANKEIGLEVNADKKLSAQPCLEIRMHNGVTV